MKLRLEFEAIRFYMMNRALLLLWMCALGNYFMKSSALQHKLFSNKTTYPIMQLLMQLMGEERSEICNQFNAIPARNMDILLLIVQRNLATIARSLGTLSTTALLVLGIAKLLVCCC